MMMRDGQDIPVGGRTLSDSIVAVHDGWRTKLVRMLRNVSVGRTSSLLGQAEPRSDATSLEACLGTASSASAASIPHDLPGPRAERSCKLSGSESSLDAGVRVSERAGGESHAAAAVAACGCTAIALASETIQFGGLAIFFLSAEVLTGTPPVEVVEAFISGVQHLGPATGAAAYCALLFALQVLAIVQHSLPCGSRPPPRALSTAAPQPSLGVRASLARVSIRGRVVHPAAAALPHLFPLHLDSHPRLAPHEPNSPQHPHPPRHPMQGVITHSTRTPCATSPLSPFASLSQAGVVPPILVTPPFPPPVPGITFPPHPTQLVYPIFCVPHSMYAPPQPSPHPQVVPVAAAFLPILCAGAIFGVPLGTFLVVLTSTASALTAALLVRHCCRARLVDRLLSTSADLAALDTALAAASWPTAAIITLLVRLSTFVPFTWCAKPPSAV